MVLGLLVITGVSGCIAIRPRDADGPAADAIEAANAITMSNERLPLLKAVARRSDLSQPVQIYLVDSICLTGAGGEQADALITLIQNPVCTADTRTHIAGRMRAITWSSERRRVAEVLGEVEEVPAESSGG